MGKDLFQQITSATGLPENVISGELAQLLASAGIEKDSMTIDDLRKILSDYVQDILLELKDDLQTQSFATHPAQHD